MHLAGQLNRRAAGALFALLRSALAATSGVQALGAEEPVIGSLAHAQVKVSNTRHSENQDRDQDNERTNEGQKEGGGATHEGEHSKAHAASGEGLKPHAYRGLGLQASSPYPGRFRPATSRARPRGMGSCVALNRRQRGVRCRRVTWDLHLQDLATRSSHDL